MADLGQTFDPASVPESERNFDAIPAGTYEAQIVDSEVKDNKAGTGKLLKLTWEVISGPFERRKVFQQLNIVHQSAQAQEIAQRELAAICEATGAGVIRDSEQLHFKPCSIRVSVSRQEGYDDKNEVKKVTPLGGKPAAPPPHQTATAAPPPRQAAAAGARPWSR